MRNSGQPVIHRIQPHSDRGPARHDPAWIKHEVRLFNCMAEGQSDLRTSFRDRRVAGNPFIGRPRYGSGILIAMMVPVRSQQLCITICRGRRDVAALNRLGDVV